MTILVASRIDRILRKQKVALMINSGGLFIHRIDGLAQLWDQGIRPYRY